MYLQFVILNAGVITASPSFSGVVYFLQLSASSLYPAFLNITPHIPPPADKLRLAAFTTASTFCSAH